MELEITADRIMLKAECPLSNDVTDNIIKLLKELNARKVESDPGIPLSLPISSGIEITSRGRLPNAYDGNNISKEITPEKDHVIDLSTLKTEKTTIVQHKYFRCPDCGQSVLIVVDGITVMRDLDAKGNLCILDSEDIKPLSEEEVFNYEDAKKHVQDVGVALAANGQTVASCPMCKRGESLIERWVEAYEKPLNFFEYESPCPICGSETTFVVERNNTVVKCEKTECGYIVKEG